MASCVAALILVPVLVLALLLLPVMGLGLQIQWTPLREFEKQLFIRKDDYDTSGVNEKNTNKKNLEASKKQPPERNKEMWMIVRKEVVAEVDVLYLCRH